MKKIYVSLFTICLLANTFNKAYCQMGTVVHTHPLTWENADDKPFINIPSSSSWQLGSPQKSFFNAAFSGTNALVTDTVNTYKPSDTSSFTLVFPDSIYQNNPAGVRVSFIHKLNTDTLKDFCFVELSVDSGMNWSPISSSGNFGNCPNIVRYSKHTNLTTGLEMVPYIFAGHDRIGDTLFSGTTNYWIESDIDIIFFIPVARQNNQCQSSGQTDNTLLRFSLVSDNIDTHKDGWLIDNINLSALDLGSALKEISSSKTTVLLSNLVSNKLYLNTSEFDGINYTIYDTNGKQVKNGKTSNEIDIADFADGMYLFTTNNNGEITKEKFVKTAKQ